jgi:hypothetical protein
MLPYATSAIAAELDVWEERERDTLRSAARRQLGSPAAAGARIALALCEVEAGLRSPLQLEQRCHLTLWPKLSARLRRSGGPAVPVGSLVRVVAQEHVPGLAEVLVLMAATISRSTCPMGAVCTVIGAPSADVAVPDMETTGSAASAAASAADLARS